MSRLLFTLIGTFALLLSGCAGYRLGATRPSYMEGVETVAVPTLRNETLLPRVEVQAASAIIQQLQSDGTFRVVDVSNADVVVQGKVAQINRRSLRSVRSDIQQTSEFELALTLDYEIIRRSTHELLDKHTVRGKTSFFVSGNDINQDERQAIPLALEDAAHHLVVRLTEGW